MAKKPRKPAFDDSDVLTPPAPPPAKPKPYQTGPKLTFEQRAALMSTVANLLTTLCSIEEIRDQVGKAYGISGRHVERFVAKVRRAWADAEAGAGVDTKRFRKHQMREFFNRIASEAYTGVTLEGGKHRPPDHRVAIRAAREVVRMDGNYTDVLEVYDKTKAPPIDEAKRAIAKRVAEILAKRGGKK